MPIVSSTVLDTKFGKFHVAYFQLGAESCVVLWRGDVKNKSPLVRVHSSCLFSESFSSTDCDCKLQLAGAMRKIAQDGVGLIVYQYMEGRGHGVAKKIKAMETERLLGYDTVQAFKHLKLDLDPRNYRVAVAAMHALGINRNIRLMCNNYRKKAQISAGGFTVTEHVTLKYPLNLKVRKYLEVKKRKLCHKIMTLDADTAAVAKKNR